MTPPPLFVTIFINILFYLLYVRPSIDFMSKIAFIGLGSNSSDKLQMLRRARILLNIHIAPIIAKSRIYYTEPWGYAEQEEFVNQVISVSASVSPRDLLNGLHQIEKTMQKQKITQSAAGEKN